MKPHVSHAACKDVQLRLLSKLPIDKPYIAHPHTLTACMPLDNVSTLPQHLQAGDITLPTTDNRESFIATRGSSAKLTPQGDKTAMMNSVAPAPRYTLHQTLGRSSTSIHFNPFPESTPNPTRFTRALQCKCSQPSLHALNPHSKTDTEVNH